MYCEIGAMMKRKWKSSESGSLAVSKCILIHTVLFIDEASALI